MPETSRRRALGRQSGAHARLRPAVVHALRRPRPAPPRPWPNRPNPDPGLAVHLLGLHQILCARESAVVVRPSSAPSRRSTHRPRRGSGATATLPVRLQQKAVIDDAGKGETVARYRLPNTFINYGLAWPAELKSSIFDSTTFWTASMTSPINLTTAYSVLFSAKTFSSVSR